jgi:hypothetical protein
MTYGKMACASLLVMFAATAAQAVVTPGADLVFDAGSNPVNGTDFWHPSVDTLPAHNLGGPREYVYFGSNVSANVVSDPSFPGIAGSYSTPGTGRNRDPDIFTGGDLPVDGPAGWLVQTADAALPTGLGPERISGTIEIWFKNNALNSGSQIIAEWGGAGRGSYFSLVDDEVSFYVNGYSGNAATDDQARVDHTLSSTGWHQLVGVLQNIEFGDGLDDDYISFYVDGQPVGDTSATPKRIDRWTGGNAWGVGQVGVSNDPIGGELAVSGVVAAPIDVNPIDPNNLLPLDGETAIVRYYYDQELNASEVLDNYNAVAAASIPGDFDNDGDVDGADFLEWQRTDGTPGGLADWQASYPNPLAAASAVSAVPEPSTGLLMVCATMLCTGGRGRK